MIPQLLTTTTEYVLVGFRLATLHQQQCLKCCCVIYLRAARPRSAETNNNVQHVQVLAQLLLALATLWLSGCCSSSDVHPVRAHWYTYTLTLQQHSRGYCLRTFKTKAITVSDMLLQQRQPPTHLNSTLPQQKAGGAKAPVPAASIYLCVLRVAVRRVRRTVPVSYTHLTLPTKA